MLNQQYSWEQLSLGYIFATLSEGRFITGADANLFPGYRYIWEFILNHYQNYKTFPGVNHLRERFNIHVEYNTLPGYGLEELSDRIRLERVRDIAETTQIEIQKVLTNESATEADIIKVLGDYQQNLSGTLQSEVVWWSQFGQIIQQYIASGNQPVAKYGIDSLDRYTDGIHEGDYVVLYGPTNQGKSTTARYIAGNIQAQGKKVLYFTLEESSRKSVLKTLSTQIHTHFKKLKKATYDEVTYNNMLSIDKTGDIAFVDRLPSKSISEIAQYIFQIQPDVVIIDQLPHLIKHSKGAIWEETLKLSSDLRQFFQNNRIPCIVLAQANRSGKKKNITPEETIALSYAIIQDASTAIFIFPDDEDYPKRKRIKIVKNRDDEVGQEIDLYWDLDNGKIEEEVVSMDKYSGGQYVNSLTNPVYAPGQQPIPGGERIGVGNIETSSKWLQQQQNSAGNASNGGASIQNPVTSLPTSNPTCRPPQGYEPPGLYHQPPA